MIRSKEFLGMLDIVAVVERHVQLKRAGGDMVGLCPLHDERTPSFRVSPKWQRFKCFGCGKGGDAITLYREMFGLGFTDACAKLAEDAGVDLSGVKTTLTEKGRRELKLAEVEIPAFERYIGALLERLRRDIDAMEWTIRVRNEMLAEIEKLAKPAGDLPQGAVEAMRDSWFACKQVITACEAKLEKLHAEILDVELEPGKRVSAFLRVFYADRDLRLELMKAV